MTFIDAAKSGRVNFDDLGQTLEDFGGVVDATFAETSDGIDQSAVAMKELQAAGAELGGEIGEVLAPILSDLAGFVREAKEAFAALTPEQKEFAAKAVLAVGAVGGLTMGFGKMDLFHRDNRSQPHRARHRSRCRCRGWSHVVLHTNRAWKAAVGRLHFLD